MPSSSSSFRRLSPSELIQRGLSPKARNYVDIQSGNLISARKYTNMRLSEELGVDTTIEKTARARERGEQRYKSRESRERTEYRKRAEPVRNSIPGVLRKDAHLIVRAQELRSQGYSGPEIARALGTEAMQRIKRMPAIYPRSQVQEALGSLVVAPESHGIAA